MVNSEFPLPINFYKQRLFTILLQNKNNSCFMVKSHVIAEQDFLIRLVNLINKLTDNDTDSSFQ